MVTSEGKKKVFWHCICIVLRNTSPHQPPHKIKRILVLYRHYLTASNECWLSVSIKFYLVEINRSRNLQSCN